MKSVNVTKMMRETGVQFGTSGARGLVSAMTDEVCYVYTRAFLQHLDGSGQLGSLRAVAIAGDLRQSTPRIAASVAGACADAGFEVIFAGYVPTPAVANFGLLQRIPSIMITGSHIPEDRNGIKFYTPAGEILKDDETGIAAQTVTFGGGVFDPNGMAVHKIALSAEDKRPYSDYLRRYLDFFPAQMLSGRTIGVYQHSSVGRDLLVELLQALGATVIPLGRSNQFVSVDTEAIRPEDVALAATWAQTHHMDAIISADGDADRPLIADERGIWIRGDVAGVLCAQYLNADIVVTPVSSNTVVERCGQFSQVVRTRIGSPFVISAMNQALSEHAPTARIVGYEANGGFLTATPITREGRTLSALPTRDAVIGPLAILALACAQRCTISRLLTNLPPRFTASDRIKDFPTQESLAHIQKLRASRETMEDLFCGELGTVSSVDAMDGLRITYSNGEIVHFRPSGNAPELRCYNEADSPERAQQLNVICMDLMKRWRQQH